jgi:hypothetical protein
MAKYTRQEINQALKEFSDVTYKKYGSYSYACGAVEGQLVSLMVDLPKHKQAEILSVFKAMTESSK